jgi:thymidine kinase
MTELFHDSYGRPGSIEVICGSMFSGKSEELIRRLRRAQIAKQHVQIFKPRLDDRFSVDHIVSHSDMKMKSELVSAASEIPALLNSGTQVIGIDEAQFFDFELVAVCNRMADSGKRVIVAGLDQDYRAMPFDPMPQLLAVAEYITKTLAICVRCGAPANRTQRTNAGVDLVMIGANGSYEARCRACFVAPAD